MVQGAVTLADGEAGADGLGNIVLGLLHRDRYLQALGKASGDGRGQRAARAVGVGRIEPLRGEQNEFGAVIEHVGGRAVEVAALDHCVLRAHLVHQHACGELQVVDGVHLPLG